MTGNHPRGLQLCLRDQAILEGKIFVADGQYLPTCLGNRKGWVNLTAVHFLNTGEQLEHIAVQTNRILWASSPNGEVALMAHTPMLQPRKVELQLEGGMTLRGHLALAPRQRLSDYLAANGDFIPLRDATLVPGEVSIGDVAVNQEAIQRLRDFAAGEEVTVPLRAPSADADAASDASDQSTDDRQRGREASGRHWLVSVARAARLAGADALDTPATTPITDAWSAVCYDCNIEEEHLARLVAQHYRLSMAELDKSDPALTARIPDKIARKYNVVPIREEAGHLVLATCNPTDHDAEQALRFASRKRPFFEIATPSGLKELIRARYSSDRMVEMLLSSVDAEISDAVRVVQDAAPESVGDEDIDAAPIIKLTNVILRDAVREGASDIHIEPASGGAVVRLRVDGVLRHHMQIPLPALTRVISRVKILADLDIADRLRPQDGRTKIQVDNRHIDLRISTVPTRGTEKCVIRVLSPEGNRRIEDIGALQWEAQRFRQLLSYREGITVVTGPTGSGKTTTLYAALREVATGEVNVMSVEDPVEYELSGITQIQVENARGVTFATALRAILRQDPDIIFVGEIRDTETAEVAVHAAMTGHLVLATLHTNDAVGAIARLSQLGVDAASIASTVRGSVAQRLIRRLCTCAQPVDGKLTTDEQRLAVLYGAEPTMRARGCKRCAGAGFKGRLPLMEVMTFNSLIQDLITQQASTSELQRAAVAGGMRSLAKVGLERVRAGETTIQEIERVIGGGREEIEEPVVQDIPTALAVQLQEAQLQHPELQQKGA
jgi:type IV pilus assembly protein PilB